MKFVNLLEINLTNKEHVDFLYKIVKYRWENHDVVNITYRTSSVVPTYEEHVEYINAELYYKHYIIRIGEVNVGSTYVDRKHTYGMFFLPSSIKQALKIYKKENTELAIRPEPLSTLAFKQLIAINPDITTFYAAVNPKNTLSIRAMTTSGHEVVEIVLRQKTIDGKLVGGNWPDAHE
jgi:hypothetical protein